MNPPVLLERDHTSLTLCWIKLSEEQADSYELQMRSLEGSDSEWVSLSNSLKGSSIRKKNLAPGVGYSFRLRFKQAGESNWSEFSQPSEDCFTLPEDWQIMEPPEVVSKDDVSITLQWKEVSGADGYMLRFRVDGEVGPNGPWQVVSTVIKTNTVRKKGLVGGATYFFSIMPVFEASGDGSKWFYSAQSAATKVATLPAFLQKLFPATLITKGNKTAPTSSLLSGKCIAIYFSAHWCGPCRQFTPKLLELYAQCKAQNKRFEVVFCSADHSEQEFQSYHASMTWPAIAFDEEHREGIMGMFKVSGIPRMVVLSASGRVVSENAISGAPLSVSMVDQWIAMSDSMK